MIRLVVRQAGEQASKQASKLQGEGKAKAGGYSSPSRPGDTKKLFIIGLLLLSSHPPGDTPAPKYLIFLSNPSSQRVHLLLICLSWDESAWLMRQTRASLSSPRRVGMEGQGAMLKVVCPASCHSSKLRSSQLSVTPSPCG